MHKEFSSSTQDLITLLSRKTVLKFLIHLLTLQRPDKCGNLMNRGSPDGRPMRLTQRKPHLHIPHELSEHTYLLDPKAFKVTSI